MGVPFYNFSALHTDEFKAEIKQRISQIIDKNAFVEGEYNNLFEKEFAELQGAKHCALVANGTDAIELALRAVDVGPGDKVGIPGISFFATAEAVITRCAEPVFIDVDSQSGLMSPKSLRNVLKTTYLKAIIPVHIYGQPAPIDELESICAPKKIKVIEDAAQGQGGYLKNGPIGSSNNLTTFSFYPTKNLAAFGDAGAILCNDDEMALKIISLRNHGRSPNGHAISGVNSRCDHIQAAVLHLKLRKINEQNAARKEIAKKYHRMFEGCGLRLVPDQYIDSSSWHLYPVGLKNKGKKYALQAFLKEKGIGNSLFYEKSLPEERPLKEFKGETTNAIDFAGKTICLPMNPFLSDQDIEVVVGAVREFLDK
ncbi:MAG: DegT/DnrJ/EryC1/StrS aminotransferase family protein [Pseudomonadota bacterium]